MSVYFPRMPRIRSIFAGLALTLIGCVSSPGPQPLFMPTSVNVKALESKTVALVIPEGDSVRAYCSGVWVNRNTILTANHCVRESQIGEVIEYSAHDDVYAPGHYEESSHVVPRNSVLSATDVEHDLALLVVAYPPSHESAVVAMSPVEAGQRVFTMGAPLGALWSYSSGEVAAVRYVFSHGYNILFIQSTAPISGGNSGGGLWNEHGELVGICHATYSKGQNMNLWIHYKYVDAMLKGT